MPAAYSVEVQGVEAKEGESKPRRSTLSPDKLLTVPEPGVQTIFDVIQRSARLFPQQQALGYRDLLKVHSEQKELVKTDSDGNETKETKTWKLFECSDYKYWTYAQLASKVKAASSGLANLGLNKGTHFNIYAATSPHWQLAAWACSGQSITFCTSYDSLGEEGLIHSLNEPEVVGLFTNADLLPMLKKVIAQTPTVKVVIYDGERADQALVDGLVQSREGLKVVTLDELLADGEKNPVEYSPPKPDDICCIMYTSGSTGKPKGVVIKHSNLVASIAGILTLLGDYIKPGESYMAYLPLAHILEFIVECAMVYVGIPMGYGSVKTLTDTNMRNSIGDIRAFKPTIMVGVPAVWELIRKGIATKVKAGGALKSKLFHGAMAAKQASPAVLGPIADAVVFKKVKEATGGRLKYALSGGAAISTETQEFLMTCLVTLIQGYGMTESCGMCAILPPNYARTKTVGMPVPSIEIKLKDVPDAGYYANKNPSQGEILIRGASVTSGYFKRDDLNKESFDDEGWFATGDIGQWAADGTLSIIDRKKNLVKLSGGEYIALERLESTYKASPIVSNIMVHADTNARQPMAVVFAHEANLKSLVNSNSDLETLCKDPKVKAAALRDLNATGKKAGFRSLELLQEVLLTHEEWTPQNGLLTAAQKLQRKQIFDHYKDQINKVYP